MSGSGALGSAEAGWLGAVDRGARAHPWAVDALFALALVAVLGSLSLSAMEDLVLDGARRALVFGALGVLHVTVALRRAVPLPAFLVAALAMLVVVALPDIPYGPASAATATENGLPASVPVAFLPSSLAFLPVLAVAARQGRRVRGLALAVGIVGAGLVTARVVGWLTYPGWWLPAYVGAGLLVTVLAAWGLGRFQTLRAEWRAAERDEAARLAVLEERARIARDVHDVVAHSLAVIVRQAEGGAYVAARAPDRAARALATIADAGRDALDDIRGLLGVLHTPPPSAPQASQPRPEGEEGGVEGAGLGVRSLGELGLLVGRVREAGLAVELDERGAPVEIGGVAEVAAYRVVQEALTNTMKHAGPGARAVVTLDWSAAGLTVLVTDSAVSPAGGAGTGTGSGLRGLRERVAAAGGEFEAGPSGQGFRVRAVFPARTGGEAR